MENCVQSPFCEQTEGFTQDKKIEKTAALRWGLTIVFFGYHDELCNLKKQIIKHIFGTPDTRVLRKTPYALRS